MICSFSPLDCNSLGYWISYVIEYVNHIVWNENRITINLAIEQYTLRCYPHKSYTSSPLWEREREKWCHTQTNWDANRTNKMVNSKKSKWTSMDSNVYTCLSQSGHKWLPCNGQSPIRCDCMSTQRGICSNVGPNDNFRRLFAPELGESERTNTKKKIKNRERERAWTSLQYLKPLIGWQ